jgi:hypothetical protein
VNTVSEAETTITRKPLPETPETPKIQSESNPMTDMLHELADLDPEEEKEDE